MLDELIQEILCGGELFLDGLHSSGGDFFRLLHAATEWSGRVGRTLPETLSVLEPCLRQTIFMSLMPAAAFDPGYTGSIPTAVQEHARQLGLGLTPEQIDKLTAVCVNVLKLRGLDKDAARRRTWGLAQLKALPQEYDRVRARQESRCIWCGVPLDAAGVHETLEHLAPKHIGDDMTDGSNWALACQSCNAGKADSLSWAATSIAHDYFSRTDFAAVHQIGLPQRFVVLRRSSGCDLCQAAAREAELWVYKRVGTGLPIPALCSTTCVACANARGFRLLEPRWAPKELGRVVPA